MELRQYFGIILKWWWLMALSVIIAATSSFLVSRQATPIYETKTTIMVGRVTENPDPSSTDLYTGQALAFTYTQLATREPVLSGVVKKLGLNMSWRELQAQVTTNIISQSNLIEILVKDSDPERARLLADTIAQELINQGPAASNASEQQFIASQIEDLKVKIRDAQDEVKRLNQELDAANSAQQINSLHSQLDVLDGKISDWQKNYTSLVATLRGGPANSLTVLEPAYLPYSPISPNIPVNVVLSAAAGLLLAVAGIFLIEYLDDTIKSREDILRVTNFPALASIGTLEGSTLADKLIAERSPLSPLVEGFRALRLNIMFSSVDKPLHTIMVTSPMPGEGKSLVLANLAVVMAQAGQRVIVVDTDMRRPALHRIFNLPNTSGLSDAILNTETIIPSCLQKTSVENLLLLASGPLPPSPAEVLGSERMHAVIETLKSEADVVLFDSPPHLLFVDSSVLASRVDGIVLVNRASHTRSSEAARSAEELQRLHGNMLGVVLNRAATSQQGTYDYYRYYRPTRESLGARQMVNGLVRSIRRRENHLPGK